MKSLFEEYGDVIVSTVCSVIVIALFISAILIRTLNINVSAIGDNTVEVKAKGVTPIGIRSFEVKDILIGQGEEINYNDRVKATNNRGDFGGSDEDISNFISLYGTVDTGQIGEKEVTYVLRYNGESRFAKARLIVVDRQEEGT